jgi:hypothetical protein
VPGPGVTCRRADRRLRLRIAGGADRADAARTSRRRRTVGRPGERRPRAPSGERPARPPPRGRPARAERDPRPAGPAPAAPVDRRRRRGAVAGALGRRSADLGSAGSPGRQAGGRRDPVGRRRGAGAHGGADPGGRHLLGGARRRRRPGRAPRTPRRDATAAVHLRAPGRPGAVSDGVRPGTGIVSRADCRPPLHRRTRRAAGRTWHLRRHGGTRGRTRHVPADQHRRPARSPHAHRALPGPAGDR